ncbi:hypothetical protein Shyhy01_17970 [Streptomyces hygroscopicus subsp. hygroscopicus]|nr:hypothetical protein Shyhy01_17970 [Streptomyces hygroscopicus subsp. hygroscopicus]
MDASAPPGGEQPSAPDGTVEERSPSVPVTWGAGTSVSARPEPELTGDGNDGIGQDGRNRDASHPREGPLRDGAAAGRDGARDVTSAQAGGR